LKSFDYSELEPVIKAILQLPERYEHLSSSQKRKLKRRLDSALYWVREPRESIFSSHRSDLLRVYVGYWNALECLVAAISVLVPMPKVLDKQKQINAFVSERLGKLTVDDVVLLKNFVDPPLKARATHAFQVCFSKDSDWKHYVAECFEGKDSLYQIRNDISHGNIDAENPEALIEIEARVGRLWMIVWQMFGRLLPFPIPSDPKLPQQPEN
jgi:hypothetical protein